MLRLRAKIKLLHVSASSNNPTSQKQRNDIYAHVDGNISGVVGSNHRMYTDSIEEWIEHKTPPR